jgi:hypothetical protein
MQGPEYAAGQGLGEPYPSVHIHHPIRVLMWRAVMHTFFHTLSPAQP